MKFRDSWRAAGALLAAGLILGASAAEAGSRSYTPRSSYVPRSSTSGVSPGTFGGPSDPFQDRAEQNRLMIERFQERTHLRARQREILRKQRGTLTDRLPEPPANRLTDRLYPRLEPLGSLPSTRLNQADRQLLLQSPPTNFRGEPRAAVSPSRDSILPYSYIERNTR